MNITKEQSNYIKLIAILTMLIDHMGVILFPDFYLNGLPVLRIIGRIALPLFVYQLVIGYVNTKSIKNYLSRILILAVICQIPYYCATGETLLNILFTLFLGIICMYLIDKKQYAFLSIVVMAVYVLESYQMGVDYGLYGILMIIFMYLGRNNINYIMLGLFVVNLLSMIFKMQSPLQMYSMFAIFLLFKPMSLKVKIPGWFFYAFYPVHILVLYGIKVLFFR